MINENQLSSRHIQIEINAIITSQFCLVILISRENVTKTIKTEHLLHCQTIPINPVQ